MNAKMKIQRQFKKIKQQDQRVDMQMKTTWTGEKWEP